MVWGVSVGTLNWEIFLNHDRIFHSFLSKVFVKVAGIHPRFFEVVSVAERPMRLPVVTDFLFIISVQVLLRTVVM